jgi:hypothetical protein
MLRAAVPAVLCAALTVAALTIDLSPAVAFLFVLVLIVSPAVTAWFATRGRDALTYLAAGMVAAASIAVVGGIVNEARSDDYTAGIVFMGTLLVGLMFTLPPVLVAALFRR